MTYPPLYSGACVAAALWWLITQPKLLIRDQEGTAEDKEAQGAPTQPAGEEKEPAESGTGDTPSSDSAPVEEIHITNDEEKARGSRSIGRQLTRLRPDTTAQQVRTSSTAAEDRDCTSLSDCPISGHTFLWNSLS